MCMRLLPALSLSPIVDFNFFPDFVASAAGVRLRLSKQRRPKQGQQTLAPDRDITNTNCRLCLQLLYKAQIQR